MRTNPQQWTDLLDCHQRSILAPCTTLQSYGSQYRPQSNMLLGHDLICLWSWCRDSSASENGPWDIQSPVQTVCIPSRHGCWRPCCQASHVLVSCRAKQSMYQSCEDKLEGMEHCNQEWPTYWVCGISPNPFTIPHHILMLICQACMSPDCRIMGASCVTKGKIDNSKIW